nr:PREDICTED: 39S ribosomal protein L23, mitochondrial [Bos mutus]
MSLPPFGGLRVRIKLVLTDPTSPERKGAGGPFRGDSHAGAECLYPLYQLGNPQLRVFRTNFFIQLVRPGTAQPEDTVQFRIPMDVRTRVQHGSNRRRDHRNVRIKQPDYKVAYVQLAHGQTFTFPDLFPKGKRPGGSSADEDLRDQVLEEQQQRQSPDPRRGGVPSWFGL